MIRYVDQDLHVDSVGRNPEGGVAWIALMDSLVQEEGIGIKIVKVTTV